MKIGKINSSQDGIIHSIDGHSQALSAGHRNVPKILINESDNTLRQGLHKRIKGGG